MARTACKTGALFSADDSNVAHMLRLYAVIYGLITSEPGKLAVIMSSGLDSPPVEGANVA